MRRPYFRRAEADGRYPTLDRLRHELARSLASPDTPPRSDAMEALGARLLADRVHPGSPHLRTLEWIGDRWMPLIVFILGTGTFRHSELMRAVNLLSEYTGATSVSQRVLTQKLRVLEANGLLHRSVSASVPVRTDYSLTPLGLSFLNLLAQVMDWAGNTLAPALADGAEASESFEPQGPAG